MSEKLLVPADIYDEALHFCNARRAVKNLEPITELPAGYSKAPSSCPCAKAVPYLLVGNRTWIFEGGVGSFAKHPTRFIRFFDANAMFGVLTLPVRDVTTNIGATDV